ncbi:MAG: hypothetical protein JWR76_503 [Mucilaginibacter sp.]|nr:hypothetical protein [Mucilaginibacter sp.]
MLNFLSLLSFGVIYKVAPEGAQKIDVAKFPSWGGRVDGAAAGMCYSRTKDTPLHTSQEGNSTTRRFFLIFRTPVGWSRATAFN